MSMFSMNRKTLNRLVLAKKELASARKELLHRDELMTECVRSSEDWRQLEIATCTKPSKVAVADGVYKTIEYQGVLFFHFVADKKDEKENCEVVR